MPFRERQYLFGRLPAGVVREFRVGDVILSRKVEDEPLKVELVRITGSNELVVDTKIYHDEVWAPELVHKVVYTGSGANIYLEEYDNNVGVVTTRIRWEER